MKPTRVYLLLGGMLGPDGEIDSAGMEVLIPMLEAFPQTTVMKKEWQNYGVVATDIASHWRDDNPSNVVVIGYSGGGSRATYLKVPIDLMVLYDPSPKWQMGVIGPNVKHVVCYHNTNPMMLNLGGGEVSLAARNTVTKVTTISIAMPHLAVQNDMNLHRATVQYVKELINA